MRACESLFLLSDASSEASIAASWRRSAAICWLSSSTWANARDAAPFWASSCSASSFCRPLPLANPSLTPLSRSRSFSASARLARSEASVSSRLALPTFSSDSISVSWASCAFSRCSAVSLPVTSCDRKNCTTTNTDSRNTMPRISVDSASTKPGQ
jgi:hypothetical protein